MKNLALKYILVMMCLIVGLSAKYNSLNEALKNGTSRGEAMVYGNYMKLFSGQAGFYNDNNFGTKTYLGDNSYVLSSVGLGYTSGFFYNIRAAISFMALQSFYNSGLGAKKDFGSDSTVMLGPSFLEYFDGDTAIKAGRFMPLNPFINHLIDGIWVRNASFNNLLLEGMYAKSFGQVSYYQIQPFTDLGRFGLYNLGVRYYLSDSQNDIKNSSYVYGFWFYSPSIFNMFGARLHAFTRFNNSSFYVGLDSGIAASMKPSFSSPGFDSYLADVKLATGFKWIDFSLGYARNGKNGLASLNLLGIGNSVHGGFEQSLNNVLPFFIWGGRAFKSGSNANLLYGVGQVKAFSDKLSLYLVYGATFFDYVSNAISKQYVQNELDLMIDMQIVSNVGFIIYLSSTHLSKSPLPNTFEATGGLRLSF
ncbi:hypothetical protein [Helicobacter sp. 11S02629-2]|uniref:hypothetical protein n=1 Tax=Helicobacter sp. 11S02629-2 TaxID=1476195 RepID=UPI000BA7AABF|nr:hypothetical protein [Helicobacter sp. 11S02629-2]